MIQEVTEQEFEDRVLAAPDPVLAEFYADWCGPCAAMQPVLEDLAEELPDLQICRVNVDEAREVAARYRIMSIPTILLFEGGEIVKSLVGAMEMDELLSEITTIRR